MCVIMVAKKTRPTEEMVERAFGHNHDGFGIAWWERAEGAEGAEVVWKKGVMEVEEAKRLCREIPLPYCAHFRMASVGGVKPELTHPFRINETASLELEGRTTESVLFHNGHWNPWADKALEAAIHSDTPIPIGNWSDTRAMAWMISLYGPGFMELLTTQKGVIMTAQKLSVFTAGGWDKINDVWCSNDYFWLGRSRGSHGGGVYGGSGGSSSGSTGNATPPAATGTNTTRNNWGKLCSIGKCRNNAEKGLDVCKDHDPTTAEDGVVIGEPNGNTTEPTPSALSIITGGSGNRPLVQILTLKQAEDLYEQELISKNKIKQFRKEYQATHRPGKRADRALVTLRKLSNEVGEMLLNGSGA